MYPSYSIVKLHWERTGIQFCNSVTFLAWYWNSILCNSDWWSAESNTLDFGQLESSDSDHFTVPDSACWRLTNHNSLSNKQLSKNGINFFISWQFIMYIIIYVNRATYFRKLLVHQVTSKQRIVKMYSAQNTHFYVIGNVQNNRSKITLTLLNKHLAMHVCTC